MWSIDNSFEFIEINLYEDLSTGWEEREKDGFPRLMEALHSQTWESMKIRGSSEATQVKIKDNRGYKSTEEEGDVLEETGAEITVPIEQHSIDPMVDKALLQADDTGDIKIFEGMAKLVNEAKGIHERARASDISDSERRDAASSIAMKFMEMLGISDSDEDERDIEDSD